VVTLDGLVVVCSECGDGVWPAIWEGVTRSSGPDVDTRAAQRRYNNGH
jgi:hypothetical protein